MEKHIHDNSIDNDSSRKHYNRVFLSSEIKMINKYKSDKSTPNYFRLLKMVLLQKLKHLWTPLCMFVIMFGTLWIFLHWSRTSISKNEHESLKNPPINGLRNNQIAISKQDHKQFPNYYEDDLRPGWKFNTSKHYDSQLLHFWTEEKPSTFLRNLTVNGENGVGYKPTHEEKPLIKKDQKEHRYNLYASEHISLHRTLPDYRFPECRKLSYPEKLPTVSVIIIFHDEAWSTLLRTVWSIIDRSPRELLEEIILVDDVSSWPNLKRPLDDYIEMLPVRIKLIRNTQREGLIRSRLIGAKAATGSVLTFFDAHMECNVGWLEPTLARIANDRSVVVVPLIDGIGSSDMGYYTSQATITVLRLHLIFTGRPIPQRELKRTKNDRTAPLRTPSHVGCAFSIDREFFFEIGSYDEGMDIWGSENVELAFRVWMCGGALEILPCSRVGHLYRISTYSFDGDAELIKMKNTARLVDVWMDEFKDFYYAANPDTKKVSPGNITDRIELRKRLQCKNFRWYLDNIHPESTFGKEINAMGAIKTLSKEHQCIDLGGPDKQLIIYGCHGHGGNQFFALTKSGQLSTVEEVCIGVKDDYIITKECSDKDQTQLWSYNKKTKLIIHQASKKCIRIVKRKVKLDICDASNSKFQWEFHLKT